MSVGTAWPVVKQALVERLAALPALAEATVLDHAPTARSEVASGLVVYTAGAVGEMDAVVFCSGASLRWDETVKGDVVVECVGQESGDTQASVDERANVALYAVLYDLAVFTEWDLAVLGLDVFDYVTLVPVAQAWTSGRVEGTTGAFATACTLGIEIRARRSFP